MVMASIARWNCTSMVSIAAGGAAGGGAFCPLASLTGLGVGPLKGLWTPALAPWPTYTCSSLSRAASSAVPVAEAMEAILPLTSKPMPTGLGAASPGSCTGTKTT
jgi:hypothetical protein